MATKRFAFADEVLALLLTDDVAAKRLSLVLKDYEFPRPEQTLVAEAMLEWTRQWNAAPKEHAPNLVADDLHPYLQSLQELSVGVHRDYVLARLEDFLREGALRRVTAQALDHMQLGEWTEIEKLFSGYSRTRSVLFDPGVRVRGDALRQLLKPESIDNTFATGIGPLDDAHIGPAPKTMYLFIAPPKRGKSWQLIHQGNVSLRHRKTVIHVTLEMNSNQVARRYVQNALSMTKRETDELEVTRLVTDNLGRLHAFEFDKVKRPALTTDIYDKANNLFSRYKFYIKEFPTRSIDVEDLRAYLDTMEDVEKVVPDLLVLDYADLMKVDAANLRVDTGVLYQSLRGLAMERGIALVTASQGNRTSSNAQWVREDMVAEDWSKIMTADTVLTYSQTADERALGLARIFVSNARDEGDKWALVVSQAYSMGQFCLDAVRLPNDVYWKMIAEASGKDTKDEADS